MTASLAASGPERPLQPLPALPPSREAYVAIRLTETLPGWAAKAPPPAVASWSEKGSGSTEARPRSEATWARQAGHCVQWATARAWRSPPGSRMPKA